MALMDYPHLAETMAHFFGKERNSVDGQSVYLAEFLFGLDALLDGLRIGASDVRQNEQFKHVLASAPLAGYSRTTMIHRLSSLTLLVLTLSVSACSGGNKQPCDDARA